MNLFRRKFPCDFIVFKETNSKIPADSYATSFIHSQGVTVSAYIRFSIFKIVQLLFSKDYEDYVSFNKS